MKLGWYQHGGQTLSSVMDEKAIATTFGGNTVPVCTAKYLPSHTHTHTPIVDAARNLNG